MTIPGRADWIALLVVAGLTFLVWRLLRQMRARARLRNLFAGSLPPVIVKKVARDPSLLKLDCSNRTVTCLSCGLRGMAELAARFRGDPAGFTRLLQRIMTPLTEQMLLHGGTIDGLTSNGFTAFWNAPLADADHAAHACEAANAIALTLAGINKRIAKEQRLDDAPLPAIEADIGIATGEVIAGGFHNHGREGYAIHGDAAARAARIQALSPRYGSAAIVDEMTRMTAELSFAFLEVDYIAQGTRDTPLKLYALLGNPVTRASPKFRALMTFHDHLFQALRARNWTEARALIEQSRKLSGASQTLYDLHLARIAYFEANPPAENWDGAFRPILN